MIKFENTNVSGFEAAIRGCRNPMNSWDKSDSGQGCQLRRLWDRVGMEPRLCKDCSATYESHAVCGGEDKGFVIGPNDMKMMKGLVRAGTDEAKFMRYIDVTVDITAPLYWWKEFDTYKVGTVANSCSTMHKIHDKEFVLEDFSFEHLSELSIVHLRITINILNYYRNTYLYGGEDLLEDVTTKTYEAKDKHIWWQMIQLLPSSYNQRRTVKLNYQVLRAMYLARRNHKLDEWREGFCEWVESLPYSELITMNGKYEDLVNRYADLVKENNQLVDEILHKNKEKEDVVG